MKIIEVNSKNAENILENIENITLIDNITEENNFINFVNNSYSKSNNNPESGIYEDILMNIPYCGNPIYNYIVKTLKLNKTTSINDIIDVLNKKKKQDEENYEKLKYVTLDIFYKNIEWPEIYDNLDDLIDKLINQQKIGLFINNFPSYVNAKSKKIIDDYFRNSSDEKNIDNVKQIFKSKFIPSYGFDVTDEINYEGKLLAIGESDGDYIIITESFSKMLKEINYSNIINEINKLKDINIDQKKIENDNPLINEYINNVNKSFDKNSISDVKDKFKYQFFNTNNLCRNINETIIDKYHYIIDKYVTSIILNTETFERISKNKFIIIDFLLLKSQIIYLINTYIKGVKILNKNITNLKLLKDEKKGIRTPILKGLINDLESETKIVIETLKKNNLTHKIKPLKRLDENSLTVGYFVRLYNESSLYNIVTDKLDLKRIEEINFNKSVKEIYQYYLDQIEKKKKKKTKRKLSDLFKFKLDDNSDEINNLRDELMDKIDETDQPEDLKKDKKDKINNIKKLRDEYNKRMLETIEKYENENILNQQKLKELRKLNDITNQNTKELLRELNSTSEVNNEISLKTRELLLNRYRQLQNKKKIEESAIEDLMMTSEKMKLAIMRIKQNNNKKMNEISEIEKIKEELINDEKEIRRKKIKMEIAKKTLIDKNNKLNMRNKQIKSQMNSINKKTLKKNNAYKNLKRHQKV